MLMARTQRGQNFAGSRQVAITYRSMASRSVTASGLTFFQFVRTLPALPVQLALVFAELTNAVFGR